MEGMAALALSLQIVEPVLLDIGRCGGWHIGSGIIMLRRFGPLAWRGKSYKVVSLVIDAT
jgi:hypothetical protein